MDIYGPFPMLCWNSQQYFILFIDDYSWYAYLFLIHEKIRYNHGDEYYGRCDGSGEQHPGPFARYLEECGIGPQ